MCAIIIDVDEINDSSLTYISFQHKVNTLCRVNHPLLHPHWLALHRVLPQCPPFRENRLIVGGCYGGFAKAVKAQDFDSCIIGSNPISPAIWRVIPKEIIVGSQTWNLVRAARSSPTYDNSYICSCYIRVNSPDYRSDIETQQGKS